MTIAQEIGTRIRYYRKNKGYTIEELARAIGKTKSCISKYENGDISMDVVTLYEIARVLEVRITQLLYLDAIIHQSSSAANVPAFFKGLNRFYMYFFDGRENKIMRCVADITSLNEDGTYNIMMYMNIKDYKNYQHCENSYAGQIIHYDSLTVIVMQNQHMVMDHYQISIPSPYMNAPSKWGLAYGISSRPLMPTSAKVLLTKQIPEENEEFEKNLKISKEDIRTLKLYNMMAVL